MWYYGMTYSVGYLFHLSGFNLRMKHFYKRGVLCYFPSCTTILPDTLRGYRLAITHLLFLLLFGHLILLVCGDDFLTGDFEKFLIVDFGRCHLLYPELMEGIFLF